MSSKFVPLKDPSIFRKLAAIMWNFPNDPHIFGSMKFDVTEALKFIKSYEKKHKVKITITHLVAKIIAIALKRHPELNAKVRFNRILLRKNVDIFLQVTADNGRDLTGVKVDNADKLSLKEIAQKISQSAKKIREGEDETYGRTRKLFNTLPIPLLWLMVKSSDFIVNELHVDLTKFGMPIDPFGSAMVTSVGMFGIDTGFAPFTPIARCPIIALITEIRDSPWVVDGKIEIRPILKICATFDHRIIDGYHAGVLAREIKDLISNPSQIEEN